MTVFDPAKTNPDDWKNSWLVDSPVSASLLVQPKAAHWEITRCLIWLGRKIQALFGYRSDTYISLSKIQSVFIEKQQQLQPTDVENYQHNIDILNAKIIKYNQKQLWNRCKIESIKKQNIANGQIETILIPELYNLIGSHLDIYSIGALKMTSKALHDINIKNKSLSLMLTAEEFIKRIFSSEFVLEEFFIDLFVRLIKEPDHYDFDQIIDLFKKISPSNQKIQKLIAWSKNKDYGDVFQQLVQNLIAVSDRISLFEIGLLNVNHVDFFNYLRASILSKTDRIEAFKYISKPPPQSFLASILSLRLAEKAPDGDEKENYIKYAKDIFSGEMHSFEKLYLCAYFKSWCIKQGQSHLFIENILPWQEAVRRLKLCPYMIHHVLEIVNSQDQLNELSEFALNKWDVIAQPVQVDFWMKIKKIISKEKMSECIGILKNNIRNGHKRGLTFLIDYLEKGVSCLVDQHVRTIFKITSDPMERDAWKALIKHLDPKEIIEIAKAVLKASEEPIALFDSYRILLDHLSPDLFIKLWQQDDDDAKGLALRLCVRVSQKIHDQLKGGFISTSRIRSFFATEDQKTDELRSMSKYFTAMTIVATFIVPAVCRNELPLIKV